MERKCSTRLLRPHMLLITFVEVDGVPAIRITIDGQAKDYLLRDDQVRLLIRQMTIWLTR